MHARVTKFEGSPSEIEAGIKNLKEQVIPNARKLAGFKGGYWLVDRTSGKGFGVTFFESDAALRASEDAAKKMREQATQASGPKVTGIERYEVVAEAHVEEMAPVR
jgi:hypothetical protein